MDANFVFPVSFFLTPEDSAVSVWTGLLKEQNSHYLKVSSTW